MAPQAKNNDLDELARKGLERASRDAERMLGDDEETEATLEKASSMLAKIRENKYIKPIIDDVSSLIRLIRAYKGGHYREIPFTSIAVALGAILYLVVPTDLIPDVIPGFGLLDDAAVIGLVLAGIHDDLEEFRKWEDKNPAYGS